jgi:hypothetical protein
MARRPETARPLNPVLDLYVVAVKAVGAEQSGECVELVEL